MRGLPGAASIHQGEPFVDPDAWAAQIRTTTSARRSRKWAVVAGAAAVVVVLAAAGGVAVATVLGGGGPQPEDVLPANAIAFAKLDLNPSAGQKLAVFQLAAKFPKAKSKVSSQDASIKELTFGSIFTQKSGMGLNYKTDVEPWLGDRVGVGVFPDLDADKKPEFGLAVAFTDKDAAKAALDKAVAHVAKNQNSQNSQNTAGYAFADDFVVVSDTNAHAAALVKAGKAHALTDSHYTQDLEKLGGEQIGVTWVDLAPAIKALSTSAVPKGMTNVLKDPASSKTTGRVVTGLRAEASFVEVLSMGVDIKGTEAVVGADAGADAGLIESFPSDVLGAFTVSGLGKSMGTVYSSLTAKDDKLGIKSILARLGITSAKQIETLLGQETGLMAGGGANGTQPQFVMRTRGSNPDAALSTARGALSGVPVEGGLQIRKIASPPGIVVATRLKGPGTDLNAALFNRSGPKLGSSEAFRQVIPQNDKVVFVGFVNLTKLVPMLKNSQGTLSEATGKRSGGSGPSDEDLASLKPLSALGVSASGGAEPVVRIRLSVR